MKKFHEYVILDYKKLIKKQSMDAENFVDFDEEQSLKLLPNPDYIAIGLTLILFFLNCFVFSFFET